MTRDVLHFNRLFLYLALDVSDFYDCDHHVEYRWKKPEDVVNIIAILHETGAILPDPDAVEIERVIREEV